LENKKIRIVHILYHYYKSDARVKAYCNYLAKNNYDVTVLDCDFFSIKKVQGKNFLSLLKHYLIFLLKSSVYLIKNRNIKIIHVNNLPNFLVFAGLFNKIFFSAKLILDNHDIMPLAFTEKSKSKSIEKLTFIEQNLSMKFADKVICADHNQMKYLIDCGISEKKITPILNVANSDIFKKSDIIRDDKEFRLIYHGTISHRLGIDLVLRALKIASSKEKNIKFYLIGEGEFLDEIKKMISELSLETNVVLTDKFVPVEKLSEIISQTDAGIIGNRTTSLSDYMLPVKLLEYVYMAKPVIAPANNIIKRYFTDDMLCFYKPENVEDMAEKILSLYYDKDKGKCYAEKAFKFTELYNYQTEMKKYQEVVNSLLM
jgi:glycosyltransferase involved in cell wall biosynthesis